jgi:hypothetical protein
MTGAYSDPAPEYTHGLAGPAVPPDDPRVLPRARRLAIPLLVTLAVVAGCRRAKAPPAPLDPAQLERGRAAVGALKAGLQHALEAALADGGPAAIEVCAEQAPAIAAAAGDGVRVGRMTRKPRNPANAVAGWQEEALRFFEARVARGEPLDGVTFARRLDGGRVAYAEPLGIQPLCTTCHGAAIAPDLAAALAARYPDDQATGYAVGDLRGVAWAEVPAARP